MIESADNGTLFLDEIGEIPINLQAKLLRALDSGEVRRLGENKIRIVDIHILSATNRNLKEIITYYPDYDNSEENAEELSLDSGLLELRDSYEKSVIIKALQKNKNRKQLTAKDLKISRMHLSKLIKKHKI